MSSQTRPLGLSPPDACPATTRGRVESVPHATARTPPPLPPPPAPRGPRARTRPIHAPCHSTHAIPRPPPTWARRLAAAAAPTGRLGTPRRCRSSRPARGLSPGVRLSNWRSPLQRSPLLPPAEAPASPSSPRGGRAPGALLASRAHHVGCSPSTPSSTVLRPPSCVDRPASTVLGLGPPAAAPSSVVVLPLVPPSPDARRVASTAARPPRRLRCTCVHSEERAGAGRCRPTNPRRAEGRQAAESRAPRLRRPSPPAPPPAPSRAPAAAAAA